MYYLLSKLSKNYLYILCLLSVCSMSNMHAQVTIGSSAEPISGALLDLKQESVTTKGLGLPRVALQSVNELKMGDRTIADQSNAYFDHIGLVVYNVTSNRIFCPGVYVWNGTTWEALSAKVKPADITVADSDGNIYKAKWFTKDPCNPAVGKYWTTSNMYGTRSGDGTALPASPHLNTGTRLNPGYRNLAGNTAILINSRADLETGATITYQEGVLNTSLNMIYASRLEFAKKFGLLYTASQATQVCPVGWHLPADSDWIDLMDALDEGAEISMNPPYSSGKNDVGQKLRKGVLWYKSIDQQPILWGDGDDSAIEHSGFDAYPSGDVEGFVSADGTHAVNFSSDAYWWSSSVSGEGVPYTWFTLFDSKALHRVDWFANSYYFSVRCVK